MRKFPNLAHIGDQFAAMKEKSRLTSDKSLLRVYSAVVFDGIIFHRFPLVCFQMQNFFAFVPFPAKIHSQRAVKGALPYCVCQAIALKHNIVVDRTGKFLCLHLVVESPVNQSIEILGQEFCLEAGHCSVLRNHRPIHLV